MLLCFETLQENKMGVMRFLGVVFLATGCTTVPHLHYTCTGRIQPVVLICAHYLCQVKGLVYRVLFGHVTCTWAHCPCTHLHLAMGWGPGKRHCVPGACWLCGSGKEGQVEWCKWDGCWEPEELQAHCLLEDETLAHQGSSTCEVATSVSSLTTNC